jgi:hypothetical protein
VSLLPPASSQDTHVVDLEFGEQDLEFGRSDLLAPFQRSDVDQRRTSRAEHRKRASKAMSTGADQPVAKRSTPIRTLLSAFP